MKKEKKYLEYNIEEKALIHIEVTEKSTKKKRYISTSVKNTSQSIFYKWRFLSQKSPKCDYFQIKSNILNIEWQNTGFTTGVANIAVYEEVLFFQI